MTTADRLTQLARLDSWDDIIINPDFSYSEKRTAIWASRIVCTLSCGLLPPLYESWSVVAHNIQSFFLDNPQYLLLPENKTTLEELERKLAVMSAKEYSHHHRTAIATTTNCAATIRFSLSHFQKDSRPFLVEEIALSLIRYGWNQTHQIPLAEIGNHITAIDNMMRAYIHVFPELGRYNPKILKLVFLSIYIESRFDTPYVLNCSQSVLSTLFTANDKTLDITTPLTRGYSIRDLCAICCSDQDLFLTLQTKFRSIADSGRTQPFFFLNIPRESRLSSFDLTNRETNTYRHVANIQFITRSHLYFLQHLSPDCLSKLELFCVYYYMRTYYGDEPILLPGPVIAHITGTPSDDSSVTAELFFKQLIDESVFATLSRELGLNRSDRGFVDQLIITLILFQQDYSSRTPTRLLSLIDRHIEAHRATVAELSSEPIVQRMFLIYHYLCKHTLTPLTARFSSDLVSFIFHALWGRSPTTAPNTVKLRSLFLFLSNNPTEFETLERSFEVVPVARRQTEGFPMEGLIAESTGRRPTA